jgi:hypothetical protein
MFATSLLDEWWKRLDPSRVADQSHNDRDSIDGSSYDDFLERQKDVWTPSDLYKKCCPRFLAGGTSHRNKNGQFVCGGGCRKIHPIITLYFDADNNCTIATLSCGLDPFKNYFDQCVNEGSAVWKSPLYCELKGFLRQNLYRLQHEKRFFGGHLVKTAIGALKSSDAAQRSILEEVHLRQHLRRHGQHRLQCDNAVNTVCASPFINTKSASYQDIGKLECVLEICRLWGLGDNLDVLSIDCMLRTSQVFRKVAIHMAEKRVNECKFVVTPLVDGHMISGYSVFRRADSNQRTVFEREHGRLVEYAVCSSILCRQKRDNIEDASTEMTSEKRICGRFLPVTGSNISFDQGSEKNRNSASEEESIGFSWACEELSYANLELECMDTCFQEYIGQKVIIQWERSDTDVPDQIKKVDQSVQDSSSSTSMSMRSEMPVFRLKLDWARQKTGIAKFSIPHFDLKLDVRRTSMSQVDEVTFLYEGHAEVLECRADFHFLVAAYARSLEPCLKANHQQFESKRPLMRHEDAFLQEVKLAASLCPLSSCICK